ncbi:hypothetical protein CBS147343_653 [Aspergillus niger]|nr:hypothetical protein CBS147343_653 [Aspergillus niger]
MADTFSKTNPPAQTENLPIQLSSEQIMTLQDMPQDKESLNVIELLKAHVKTLEEQCHKAQEERLKAWEECDKARKERNESSKNAVETIEKVNRDAAELRKENQELKAELSKVQGWRNLFEQPATKNSGTAKEKNDRKPKIRRKGRADRYGPNRIERSVYPEFTFTPSPPPPDPGPACSFATPPSDPSQNLNLNIAKLEHTHDGELQSGNKTEAGREPRPKKRVRFELDTCPEEPTAEGIPSSRDNAPYPDPEWVVSPLDPTYLPVVLTPLETSSDHDYAPTTRGLRPSRTLASALPYYPAFPPHSPSDYPLEPSPHYIPLRPDNVPTPNPEVARRLSRVVHISYRTPEAR